MRLPVTRTVAMLTAALALAAASACGGRSSSPTAARFSQRSTSTVGPAPSGRPPRNPAPPAIGVAQRVRTSGTTLSVRINRLLDPLGGSGASLVAGTRAIGLLVRIANYGPGIYDSSATGDVSVVPSTGTVTPVFAARGICQTPLRDFDNYISPGEVRSGCVALAVDSAARILAVRFSPHGQASGRVSWRP